MARNRNFVFAPFDASLNVMPHTASRRSLLSAVRSSSSRRRLARSSTRRVLIPCAHGKLNVKHHRTTLKPAIHTSITAEKDEAALASTKTYTGGGAAAGVRVYTYVCIQARPLSTNSRFMEEECEYGLPSGTCFTARRLEVVAVAGLLWIYFVVVSFFSVWWDFVFFSFSLLRTHTAYCKYEATLPHVPLY